LGAVLGGLGHCACSFAAHIESNARTCSLTANALGMSSANPVRPGVRLLSQRHRPVRGGGRAMVSSVAGKEESSI
jgi:hypothetical protein